MDIRNDYFKLFLRREGVVVLGRRMSNLWLLSLVLVATFLAIAFSNGSLQYLDYKMNDPFINWVDIDNQDNEDSDFQGLLYDLSDDAVTEQYHINGYQSDYKFYFFFFGKEDGQQQYLGCRFFGDMRTPLVEAILDGDNVVDNTSISDVASLDESSVGVIITKDAIEKLGYKAPYPAYIDLYSYSPEAGEYGIIVNDQLRARAPLPVLGVVKRLPGNVDLISSTHFYCQRLRNDNTHPFDMGKPEYGKSLCYYLPDDVDSDEFGNLLGEIMSARDTVDYFYDCVSFYPSEQINYKFSRGEGVFAQLIPQGGEFSCEATAAVHDAVMERYSDTDVHRLYEYRQFFRKTNLDTDSFMSIHFADLNRIKEFEAYVNSEYGVKLEMAQINAKENFNAVRIMANILSWVMIAFAIICIVLFIVNLLQSYFQKVKRNLGTFKAFGISNRELISIYLIIMLFMVVSAIIAALLIVAFIQVILPVMGVLKDGEFNYLSLWNTMTLWSVIIIISCSVFTVYKVMSRMLRQTPGDLIYDRE